MYRKKSWICIEIVEARINFLHITNIRLVNFLVFDIEESSLFPARSSSWRFSLSIDGTIKFMRINTHISQKEIDYEDNFTGQ